MLSNLPWILLCTSLASFLLAKWLSKDARHDYQNKLDIVFAEGRPRDPVYEVLRKAKGQGMGAGIGLMSVALFIFSVFCLIEKYWGTAN